MNNPNAKNMDKQDKNKTVVRRIKPSMRDKERYVAYEIASKEAFGWGADKALVKEVNVLLGVFMAPKANIASIKYNAEKQRGILRINRKFVDCLKTCFAMIKHINNQEVLVRTVKVSGMVGKVKKYIE
jgi:RNase P/RNase MRP subunit POP5